MDRISQKDVTAAFKRLVREAELAGIQGTAEWKLYIGNSTYGYNYRIADGEGRTVGRSALGTTRREAREAMLNMAEAFYMMSRLNLD